MARSMTEDEVRDEARVLLHFESISGATYGVGQLTTFNQLGFPGANDKPDGWCLPSNHMNTALILETKATRVALGDKQAEELKKNIRVAQQQYRNVVGILYNGEDVRVFKNDAEVPSTGKLETASFYLSMFKADSIDKERIYELTAKINDSLHFDFGIKNLYHRMIFTACALVAKRYGAFIMPGMGYSEFHNAILNCLNKELIRAKQQNRKLELLSETFAKIEMNLDTDSEEEKEQQRIKNLIACFIEWVAEISDCLNSDAWRGEDVMGIFFNEFNRYKKKSEAGQVFTPEHITDFMYRIIEVNKDDKVLDAACGSGGFLIKAMANMIAEAGGVNTEKARSIKQRQLFGIELDKEIYALACANMLIHKDGKTNLEQLDSRYAEAGTWISHAGKQKRTDSEGKTIWAGRGITKVLMNPPFENKYGCMNIVENVLDNVPSHTMCAFILPEKKLEKASKAQMRRILKHHRLRKIVKLPEDLFLGAGITTSVFVFETGAPQNDNEIFACYMERDGLQTVKNKGRHDVRGEWPAIEDYWVDVALKQSGDDTCQWLKPSEHLSYQMPEKPFEIFEEDFRKTTLDYLLFQRGVNAKEFEERLAKATLYTSRVDDTGDTVTISLPKGEDAR